MVPGQVRTAWRERRFFGRREPQYSDLEDGLMDTIQDWLTLHFVDNLGATGCHRLLEAFGSVQDVFRASRRDLEQVAGIRQSAREIIVSQRPRREAEQELERAHRLGVTVLSFGDPDYPALLRNIYAPPIVLYIKGEVSQLNRAAIAVVGSRAATTYGLKIAASLARELAAQGLVVVSGLALGIDAAAHAAALEVAGGATVAVLGCGLDVCYPSKNRGLAEKIAAAGALVSEYPFGTEPEAFRFPARNRIISGLALGVLVVEAAIRSGSLITARQALEQGREVFAVPGRVDSFKSAGAHRLLQEGAKLVHTVGDILEELPGQWREVAGPASPGKESGATLLSEEEQRILAVLDEYPRHFDTIMNQAGLPVHKLNELLLMLELQGMVECLPGQQYRVNTEAVAWKRDTECQKH